MNVSLLDDDTKGDSIIPSSTDTLFQSAVETLIVQIFYW